MINVIIRSASDIMDIERHCTSLRLPSFHLNNCFQNNKLYIHGIQIQLTDRSSNSVSAFIFLPLIPFVILDNSGTCICGLQKTNFL